MTDVPDRAVVQMSGVTKRFPGVVANDAVDFTLAAGEVHALLGENGAGKSTLMNILYGLYSADSGKVFVRGKEAEIDSPRDAIALGISMVHQHFELVDTLTVAENVALGLRSKREPLLDLEGTSAEVSKLGMQYGLEVAPTAKVHDLSVGEKQRVEILKALYRGTEILILDEPTSVLTPQETEELFRFLRSMASHEKSVVFITHKLQEVMDVSDSVTVLRKGKVVGRTRTRSTSPDQLAVMMVGRELGGAARGPQASPGAPVLKISDLKALGDKGDVALRGFSLTLSKGEILGIAGVAGNGQRELVEVLSGTRRAISGSVEFDGAELTSESPSEIIRRGMGVIPEDRRVTGVIMEFSIAENLVLESRGEPPYSSRGLLNEKEIRAHGMALAKEFSIDTPDVSLPAYTLSGGNLQRLMLAKVLSRRPAVIIADQPTAGLDVGATQFIWEKLRSERDRGVGVLLISSDLSEILALSDRVACVYEGVIAGSLKASEADSKKLGLLMGGVKSG